MKKTIETEEELQQQPAPQIDGSVLTMLQHHRSGQCISDLSAAMRQLAQEVVLSGKPGSFSLKITLKPAQRVVGGVIVEDEIAIKGPKMEKENSIFYADQDTWQLLRNDPKQGEFNLRTIETKPAELKELKSVAQ